MLFLSSQAAGPSGQLGRSRLLHPGPEHGAAQAGNPREAPAERSLFFPGGHTSRLQSHLRGRGCRERVGGLAPIICGGD